MTEAHTLTLSRFSQRLLGRIQHFTLRWSASGRIVASLIAARSHAAAFACLRIDGNQESVAIAIGELVALRVGAVLNGLVQLEPAVVLCAEVFYVSQNHAASVRAGLALELHGSHLAAAQLRFN